MQIQFLGTGSGLPSKERNVSSIALKMMAERGEVWLFDCGEATQHTILHTSIRPRKIRKIFITHLHGDHIFGLPGLLCSRSFQGGVDPLTVYGPKGISDFIQTALNLSQSHLSYPLEIVELDQQGEVFADTGIKVQYRTLHHSIQSYGYRIIESEQAGGLQADKLNEFGIPNGPIWGKLKQGQSVTLSDGRLIHGKDYLAPPIKGREIVIFGDTRFSTDHADFCRDADVLVHEATFAKGEDEIAAQFGHSSCTQAAELAKIAGVRRLYLSHLSARHIGRTEQIEQEARSVFSESYVVHDLYEADIPLHKL